MAKERKMYIREFQIKAVCLHSKLQYVNPFIYGQVLARSMDGPLQIW